MYRFFCPCSAALLINMAESYEICIICNAPLSNSADIVTLRVKAAEGVNIAAHERGVDIVVTAGSCVHITCRQKFTDKKDISLSRQRNEESSCTRKRSYRISDMITVHSVSFVELWWTSTRKVHVHRSVFELGRTLLLK